MGRRHKKTQQTGNSDRRVEQDASRFQRNSISSEEHESQTLRSESDDDEYLVPGRPNTAPRPGMACTLHKYDCRENARGDKMTLRTGTMLDFEDDETYSPEAALVLTRHFGERKQLKFTVLDVQSPHIKAAMCKVMGYYPETTIGSLGNIRLYNEPRCLFHYRKELLEYAQASNNCDVVSHVELCLQHMAQSLKKEKLAYESTMENTNDPGLEFEHLWMAFKPNELVFSNEGGVERLYRLSNRTSVSKGYLKAQFTHWLLELESVDTYGTSFGYTAKTVRIEHFEGCKPLRNLPYYPLQYHTKQGQLRRKLIRRGKRFVSFYGIHYMQYKGVAEILLFDDRYSCSINDRRKTTSTTIRDRIMLDFKIFNEKYPNFKDVQTTSKLFDAELGDHLKLSDDDFLICSHQVPGFLLTRKAWGLFDVSLVVDVDYDTRAFERLVLPEQKKSMISSLIKSSDQQTLLFDDFITGKGKGIVFLLHGPPGVGKTFTAESIAEYTRRPLYTISCDDLGLAASWAEKSLTSSLSLAERWNAVVLIDEADVFMAERTLINYYRNELVSVLLRKLEYFQGIMFLTSNRSHTIDPAFKSRIHLTIAYQPLPTESRRALWKEFALQGSGQDSPSWLDDAFLDRVAEARINGRQIKNTMRVACAIAQNDRRLVTAEDVYNVLDTMQSFNDEPEVPVNLRKVEGGYWVPKPSQPQQRPYWSSDIAVPPQTDTCST